MCAIVGAVIHSDGTELDFKELTTFTRQVFDHSRLRGRDGVGFSSQTVTWDGDRSGSHLHIASRKPRFITEFFPYGVKRGSLVGNLRAEPTTEYVEEKQAVDQQPYTLDDWTIVHNGTIANDKLLRTHRYPSKIDSAAIVELLAQRTGQSRIALDNVQDAFKRCILELKGSYAIIARHSHHPNALFIACNYRPVWYVRNKWGLFFGSSRSAFIAADSPQMLRPYTMYRAETTYGGRANLTQFASVPRKTADKALVVCSGGLDSVVSAVYARDRMKLDIELLHFTYGSRAEGPEVKAVQAVGERMNCKVTIFPLNVYKPGDSPLLDKNSKVAGGEEGAEYAHEWVPARNLLLLAVATAYAEANGFSSIVLGNNLEEAGAYPDNEPEFIDRFNDLLPFAVGDGKAMEVLMPVGNMMKHEIVKLGVELKAPLDLTWSCYRAGSVHCGSCGPCYMRRKAFEINNLPEVIEYETPFN